jgi:transketolase
MFFHSPMSHPLRFLRQHILRATACSGEGHLGSAFSILDILWVLYNNVLRIDPANPRAAGRDRFVLSKGHAAVGLYAILAQRGFISFEDLMNFAASDSSLGGHPDGRKVPGVEASTGSLGHGMPMAVGMAMGLRIKAEAPRVVTLIGDGEANEGAIWEAAMLAVHHKLGNLTCVVDYNHSGDRALRLGDLCRKFATFGWDSCEVDGHDHLQILQALTPTGGDVPRLVVANTIKGKGCPEMENNPAWHHKIPTPTELESLIAQLT